MKILFFKIATRLLLVLFGVAIGLAAGSDIGFKNGWTAFAIDYNALQDFHDSADQLPMGATDEDLNAIWRRCQSEASINQAKWYSIPLWSRLQERFTPSWKTEREHPKRMTPEERQRMIDALRGTTLGPKV